MTATLHALPTPATPRDRTADLVRANTALALRILMDERFIRQIHEYAIRNGDALLAQMTREYLEGMER